MVAFTGPQVGAIKINGAIGKLKVVRPDGNLVRIVRALGILFWRLVAKRVELTGWVDSLIVGRQAEPVG